MIDLAEVLPACFPGSTYVWVGSPTNQTELDEALTWLDESPKPTWEQLELAWATELSAREQLASDVISARESAATKLANLGLTPDEIVAIIGTPPTSPVVP
jgi:hypothetical protein